MTHSPEKRTLADGAFAHATQEQQDAKDVRRAQLKAAEHARVAQNRRRWATRGTLASAALVAMAYGGADVVDSFKEHMGAEQAAEKCVVINEPLGNRLVSTVAVEQATDWKLNVNDAAIINDMTNVILENGGPANQPFVESSAAGPLRQIEVELCVSDPTAIPVRIFSKDGLPK